MPKPKNTANAIAKNIVAELAAIISESNKFITHLAPLHFFWKHNTPILRPPEIMIHS